MLNIISTNNEYLLDNVVQYNRDLSAVRSVFAEAKCGAKQLTLGRQLGSAILDLILFFKKSKRTGINSKLRQNADEMYKLVNFMKQTGKTTEVSQKAYFWPNLNGFAVICGSRRNNNRLNDK